jgi:hypothetical protein
VARRESEQTEGDEEELHMMKSRHFWFGVVLGFTVELLTLNIGFAIGKQEGRRQQRDEFIRMLESLRMQNWDDIEAN